MGFRSVVKQFIRPLPTVIFLLLLLVAVVLLASSAQHASTLSAYFPLLFFINLAGTLLLLLMIAANIYRLVKEVREQQLGSRLTIRFLMSYGVLALVPLAIVYAFSVQFLNQSIDSWFDVRIEKALDNAVLVGQNSMEAVKSDLVANLQEDINMLSEAKDDRDLFAILDEILEQNDLTELSIFSSSAKIIASSNADVTAIVPDAPDEHMLSATRRSGTQSLIEPLSDKSLQLRLILPMPVTSVDKRKRYIQALYRLPFRFSNVGDSLEQASTQYSRLVYLRRPLKLSFIMTLTLITLLTGLAGLWSAILSSRKLMAPLRDLAAGTQAVASGDYSKELPVTSADELGVLVQSFNDMTSEIKRTQEQARQSQSQLEDQHAYLETVLSNLSSGVLSFDLNHQLGISNQAAQQILHIDLVNSSSENIDSLKREFIWLKPMFESIQQNMRQGRYEWQNEIQIVGPKGRQLLNVRGSRLPYESLLRGGIVVVFDDLSNLVQAQRDAAWGEVARRLAHEIKNPLTPIALSAERIRNKFMDKLQGSDREALDRATRTIGNQVESMKQMVNEFSEYAQPVRIQKQLLDFNQLIIDVVDLHQSNSKIKFELSLDKVLPKVTADTSRMRQVLNNLIINARDALTEVDKPCIKLMTRAMNIEQIPYLELSIIDNGNGFDEQLLDRLFEPYVSAKDKGTGLGLAIVKRIIDEHEGVIRATNMPTGGAEMVINLPIELNNEQLEMLRETHG